MKTQPRTENLINKGSKSFLMSFLHLSCSKELLKIFYAHLQELSQNSNAYRGETFSAIFSHVYIVPFGLIIRFLYWLAYLSITMSNIFTYSITVLKQFLNGCAFEKCFRKHQFCKS